ncbi:MAG TPA: hypothetical protein VFA67_07515 [Candidatus Sulfotelmatobacter sp.]|nr:hypothetical protein [Candidatus Sulfotelmatobacter sp.]
MARLSSPVDKAEFENSWHNDPTLSEEPRVEFFFVGQTVSAIVHSDYAGPWSAANFHEVFHAAIWRLKRTCNMPRGTAKTGQ